MMIFMMHVKGTMKKPTAVVSISEQTNTCRELYKGLSAFYKI